MTQATDIIKQLQEALVSISERECSRKDIPYCHACMAEDTLKLIPLLLEQAEKWEKGVSLEAIAKSLAEDTWFEADVLNCDRYVENHWKEHIQYAKAVLDKAEVKYYE